MDTEKDRETSCRLWQATGSGELICGEREREREIAIDRVKERERGRACERVGQLSLYIAPGLASVN